MRCMVWLIDMWDVVERYKMWFGCTYDVVEMYDAVEMYDVVGMYDVVEIYKMWFGMYDVFGMYGVVVI